MTVHRISKTLIARTLLEPIGRALNLSGHAGDATAAATFLADNCANPAVGLWMGLDDTQICGIIACILPTNPLVQSPEIPINANWGRAAIGKELVEAAIGFAKQAGYSTLIACNRTRYRDEIFQRHYRKPGREIRRLGTLWEFREPLAAS